MGDLDALRGDAAQAASAWRGPVAAAAGFDLGEADLVIDALFGAGLARDLTGEARACVERINTFARSARPVLAVDLPSGIDGNTGAERGVAVRASASVTFFRLKPGHLLLPGRAHCGRLALADIGIGAADARRDPPQRFRQCASDVARGLSRICESIPTNMRAARPSCSREARAIPARRGWRRGRRCASGPALSPSPARSKPRRSMPLIPPP